MVKKVVKTVAEEDRLGGDVLCCTILNGNLFTGGDSGEVKCWDSDLNLLYSWKAHQYVVYDIAVNPDKNVLYSCSMDGEINKWQLYNDSNNPTLIKTAIQTGPSGEGSELPGLGDGAGLDTTPTTVRKLLWKNGFLYSADDMGSLCRWNEDLELLMKKEFFTEIWSFCVDKSDSTAYTARDNEIIVADVASKTNDGRNSSASVMVTETFPGRAPVELSHDGKTVFSVGRTGLQAEVWTRDAEDKRSKIQVLQGHDMIINCIIVGKESKSLITAGWDALVNFWEKSSESPTYALSEGVKVDSYVNCMCNNECNEVFVAGKDGYIAKIA